MMNNTIPLPPNEDMGPTILATTTTVCVIAFISLLIRLYVRSVAVAGTLGWDDFLMVVAMTLTIAGQGIIIPEVRYGAGRHIQYLEPDVISMGLFLNYLSQPIMLWAITFVKLSVGFFLLRISSGPFFKKTIITIMIFMAVYTFACFWTIIFQCSNPKMLWDPTATGTCMTPRTLRTLGAANVAINIITDFLFALIIPIPMLYQLNMNKRTMSTVVCILGLGVFASAAAAVKASYLSSYGKTGDFLWDSTNLTIWTMVECCSGITASNLPALRPLFRRVLGATYGSGWSRSRSSNRKNTSTNTYLTSANPTLCYGPDFRVNMTPASPSPTKEDYRISKIETEDSADRICALVEELGLDMDIEMESRQEHRVHVDLDIEEPNVDEIVVERVKTIGKSEFRIEPVSDEESDKGSFVSDEGVLVNDGPNFTLARAVRVGITKTVSTQITFGRYGVNDDELHGRWSHEGQQV